MAPETFLDHVQSDPPDIIGLSGLITAAYKNMRETIQLLAISHAARAAPMPVIIGGRIVNERVRYSWAPISGQRMLWKACAFARALWRRSYDRNPTP